MDTYFKDKIKNLEQQRNALLMMAFYDESVRDKYASTIASLDEKIEGFREKLNGDVKQ